jgi:hypothetical protein
LYGHLMPDWEDRTRREVDRAWSACAPAVPRKDDAGCCPAALGMFQTLKRNSTTPRSDSLQTRSSQWLISACGNQCAGDCGHMAMTASVPMCLALLASGALSACAGETDTVGSTSGDCVSHYDFVARAPTWPGLKDAMVDSSEWGRVASVRTQARGNDVGAGDRDAVRVVDLVNRNGRRLIQVDVWRTDAGAWRAGAWSQCID